MDLHPHLCKCLACIEVAAVAALAGAIAKRSTRDDFTFATSRPHAAVVQRQGWDNPTPLPDGVGFELSPVGTAGTAGAGPSIYYAAPPEVPIDPAPRYIYARARKGRSDV